MAVGYASSATTAPSVATMISSPLRASIGEDHKDRSLRQLQK